MNEFEKDWHSGEPGTYGEPAEDPAAREPEEPVPEEPIPEELVSDRLFSTTPAEPAPETPHTEIPTEAEPVAPPFHEGPVSGAWTSGPPNGYAGGSWAGNSPPPPSRGWNAPPGRFPYGQNQGGSGYAPGGYPGGGQRPGGAYHQYGTNSGWQQPPPTAEKYEWKFADYEQLEQKQERKKQNRGLVVFTVSLLCVMAFGLIFLAGYGIYTSMPDSAANGVEASSAAEDGASADFAAYPPGELELASKPDTPPTVSGRLTTPEVVKTVRASVVAVIKYDNNYMAEAMGLGSGIIMSEDGYIITNAHVISQGTDYQVQLHNGDTYAAVLIGADDLSDVAVLKIDAENLSPASFGDSNQLEVGETVVAIGNPGGLELAGSVTQGIVSALNREVRSSNSMSYIQTDAAINPGISGGALVNEFAQVVGITSNKIVAEGYEGLGFAIPISDAKPIIDDLIANGRVTGRAMLGIRAQTVDPSTMGSVGERGIYIGEIESDSDLNRSVLKGDIITHVDGIRVYSLGDLRRVLDSKQPGDVVTLTIYRRIGTKESNFDVSTRLQESESSQDLDVE